MHDASEDTLRRLGEVLLEAKDVSKTFAGVKALDSVSFQVRSGEVTAVVGHNGSGKSTLVKVLAGVHEPDQGGDPGVTHEHGETRATVGDRAELHFIHQSHGFVDLLSAVENFALVASPGAAGLRPVRASAERKVVEQSLESFGVAFDVTRPLRERSAPERAILAIARAMHGWVHDRNILVLDEPTEALHRSEVGLLFQALRAARSRGTGIVFISHRLDEVLELADRVVVLRDGQKVADRPASGLTRADLVAFITGGTGGAQPSGQRGATQREGGVRLSVSGLSGPGFDEVSFEVRGGEILGISGLLGSGREHVAGGIFGATTLSGGAIEVDGRPLSDSTPRAAIRAGMALVPGDRAKYGIVPTMSVRENITLPRLRPLRGRLGAIDRRREDAEVSRLAAEQDIRPRRIDLRVNLLSGGNQQKAVLAKWLRNEPAVLLMDEPTQGVDIGAKAAIYQAVRRAAARGAGVVVSSSDTEELAELCDRVLVLRDGRIAGQLAGDNLTEQALVAHIL